MQEKREIMKSITTTTIGWLESTMLMSDMADRMRLTIRTRMIAMALRMATTKHTWTPTSNNNTHNTMAITSFDKRRMSLILTCKLMAITSSPSATTSLTGDITQDPTVPLKTNNRTRCQTINTTSTTPLRISSQSTWKTTATLGTLSSKTTCQMISKDTGTAEATNKCNTREAITATTMAVDLTGTEMEQLTILMGPRTTSEMGLMSTREATVIGL